MATRDAARRAPSRPLELSEPPPHGKGEHGMRNPSEFGRAGPAKARLRRGWHSLGAFAALAMIVVACTGNETDKKPVTGPGVGGPNLAADIPFNAGNRCIASDAFLGGVTTGVSDSLKLASDKLCTSQDIKIATAIVDSISNDGITYTKFTGQNVQCNEGDIIFLQMA